MGELCARHRQRQRAELHRDEVAAPVGRRRDQYGHVGAGVPAVSLSGRGVSRRRASRCRTSAARRESIARSAARSSTSSTRWLKVQYGVSGDPEILSKVSQYEMAYRMQDSIPRIADISDEPRHILDLYGPDVHTPGTFARNCLLTRRLIERGVKFVQLVPGGLGSSRAHSRASSTGLRGGGSAVGRADRRPQAARAARRHARDLGQRVRPHVLRPGHAAATPSGAITTAGASPI